MPACRAPARYVRAAGPRRPPPPGGSGRERPPFGPCPCGPSGCLPEKGGRKRLGLPRAEGGRIGFAFQPASAVVLAFGREMPRRKVQRPAGRAGVLCLLSSLCVYAREAALLFPCAVFGVPREDTQEVFVRGKMTVS